MFHSFLAPLLATLTHPRDRQRRATNTMLETLERRAWPLEAEGAG